MCAKCFRKDWVYLVGVLDFPGTGLGSLGNWKSVRGQLVEKKPTLHLEQKCMVCKPPPFFGTKICHHHIYSKRCCGHHMLAMLGLSYTAVHCLSSIHCLHIVTERFHIFQFQLLARETLLGVLLHPPKSDDKYTQKSVQLARGSSFRSDFLHKPYFR